MEMLGTFALCYVGGMAVVMADAGKVGLSGVALAHGGILAIFVYIGADISGGHYNPAVSLGMFLGAGEPFLKMMMYAGAQVLGGMLAGSMITFNINEGFLQNLLDGSVLGFPNKSKSNLFPDRGALLGEFMGTFVLVLTILLACEITKNKPERKGHFALCIGFTLFGAIFAIGNITGCALNPARVLGPLLVSGTIKTPLTPYILGPIMGGACGALCYKNFLKLDKKEQEQDDEESERKESEAMPPSKAKLSENMSQDPEKEKLE